MFAWFLGVKQRKGNSKRRKESFRDMRLGHSVQVRVAAKPRAFFVVNQTHDWIIDGSARENHHAKNACG